MNEALRDIGEITNFPAMGSKAKMSKGLGATWTQLAPYRFGAAPNFVQAFVIKLPPPHGITTAQVYAWHMRGGLV